jgi:hypothetical protein
VPHYFFRKKLSASLVFQKKQVPHYFLIKNADFFFFGEITLNFFLLYSKEIMRHAGWLPP